MSIKNHWMNYKKTTMKPFNSAENINLQAIQNVFFFMSSLKEFVLETESRNRGKDL